MHTHEMTVYIASTNEMARIDPGNGITETIIMIYARARVGGSERHVTPAWVFLGRRVSPCVGCLIPIEAVWVYSV